MDGEWTGRIGIPSPQPLIDAESDAEFEKAAARILGSADIPECLRVLSGRAWIAAAMFPFFMRHDTVYVDPDLAAQAVLLSSAVNDCRYSYGFFRSRMLLVGHGAAELDRLTEIAIEGGESADEREQALIELVRFVSLQGPTGSAGGDDRAPAAGSRKTLLARLQGAGLSKEAIGELAGCIAQTGFFNRVCILLAVPPYEKAEAMPEKTLIRAVRPVLRRSIRGRRIAPIEAPKVRGPFAAALKGLRGTWYLPWATTLVDRCLDEQTAPGGLPVARRLAVIASIAGSFGAAGVAAAARSRLAKSSNGKLSEELQEWCAMTVTCRSSKAFGLTTRIARGLRGGELADAAAAAGLANLLARLERFNLS